MKNLFSIALSIISFLSFGQLYPVPVYTVTSLQPAHSGEEVIKTIDGDINTIYHSNWNQNGIPDQLDFYFTSNQSIKQIVYTPRQSGANGIWTNVDVSYSTKDNPTVFIEIQSDIQWIGDNNIKEIELISPIENVNIIRFDVNAGIGDFSSCAEMEFFSEELYENPFEECTISTDDLIIDGANDIKVMPLLNGSFASDYQPNENIEKSFDGNLSTLYHSPWGGNTQFPITLNYRFDGTSEMDYLKYIPRLDGSSNGHFGNVTVSYNTLTNSEFVQVTQYNFSQTGIPEIVLFPNTITPYNIQIVIDDGGNGYASCAEMEFYKKGETVANQIPENIFTDDFCNELLPTVNQNDINSISSIFFKELAQCLYDGTYNLQYRVQEYEVYRPVSSISQELKVGSYDQFENTTGIAFTEGEKVAVFVRNAPSVPISLKLKDFEGGYYGSEYHYSLKEGLNVFETTQKGLGYISYYNNNLTHENVEIHIVSGQVNGYFDLNTSNESEWIQLLENEVYPKLDLRGDYTHLVFDKFGLKAASPIDGKRLIQKYDTIVHHQRNMMGLFKYDRNPKNRMFGFSEDGNGYYAGHLGIHLDNTWGINNIYNPDALDLWGIPHEFGHINQIRPDLNWIGTTEVTNNIHSVWTQYLMNPQGNEFTRLEDANQKPLSSYPTEKGGIINGAINSTMIYEQPLQEGLDDISYSVFNVLVPFWQLELYYQLAGASKGAAELSYENTGDNTSVDYAHWHGKVAEYSRLNNAQGLTNGEFVMNFVKNTCEAVQEDLTDFFIKTGFLRPISKEIDDYGIGQLTITQEMIDETIDYIASQNYNQPISPVINYISAHSMKSYKNQEELTGETGVGVELEGDYLVIQNEAWKNAVAFETYTDIDELLNISIVGTGDISLQTTRIYYPENALKVFAVGYDGNKILVYPISSSLGNEKQDLIQIYPNPISKDQQIYIKGEFSELELELFTIDGKMIGKKKGTKTELEDFINQKVNQNGSGTYLLNFSDNEGKEINLKFVFL